uniref:Uncharacterized protein n=1 Tax=Avena sativa TaxID=4498 RepID=A0ACD5VAI9_AVESA
MAATTALALSSGHQMPAVGLGVWRMDSPAIRGLIHSALRAGYRHFDCAADYQNEAEVGDALAEAFETGLAKREDLFITTKLWNSDHGHVVEACKDSLKKLRLDYLDLYLIHFPVATKHTGVGTTASALGDDGVLDIDTTISLETTWHAMEDLVSMGLVRSIGISNYDIFLTRDCLAYAKIKPAVNQIETHPYFQRDSCEVLPETWNLRHCTYTPGWLHCQHRVVRVRLMPRRPCHQVSGREIQQDAGAARPAVGSPEEHGGDPQDLQGGEAGGELRGLRLRDLRRGHGEDQGPRPQLPHQPAGQVLGHRPLRLIDSTA